jgi:hypothetical protein
MGASLSTIPEKDIDLNSVSGMKLSEFRKTIPSSRNIVVKKLSDGITTENYPPLTIVVFVKNYDENIIDHITEYKNN